MKNILFILLLLSICLSSCGDLYPDPSPSLYNIPEHNKPEVVESEIYDLSAITTVGNHSYISLNLDGTVQERKTEILKALSIFENTHKELIIYGVEIDFCPIYNISVRGILIHHRKLQIYEM